MKEEMREKIAAAIADWAYKKELPEEWFGFRLQHEMHEDGDVYDIFSYRSDELKRKITVYYHEETKEYKARITVGLTEFCNIDFISSDLPMLERILRARFERALRDLAVFNPETIDSIVVEKKILDWTYLDRFPDVIEGFSLFIRPKEPLRIINGSYIVFDYCDFKTESNFIIYYNIFRDEFFGEVKYKRIPEMNYTFDSHELVELEEKLELYLLDRLKELRKRLDEAEGGDIL